MTTNSDIPFAKSLVDYIFRWLGMEFVDGYREANAPARPERTSNDTASKEDAACKDDRMSTDRTKASSTKGQDPDWTDDASTSTTTTPRIAIPEVMPVASIPGQSEDATAAATSGLNQSTAALMGDAPPCDGCGAITVRNGTCYKCMNCGNSMGCS